MKKRDAISLEYLNEKLILEAGTNRIPCTIFLLYELRFVELQ